MLRRCPKVICDGKHPATTHEALRKVRKTKSKCPQECGHGTLRACATSHQPRNMRSVNVTRRGENCDAAAFKYGRNSRTQYATYPVLRISAIVAL